MSLPPPVPSEPARLAASFDLSRLCRGVLWKVSGIGLLILLLHLPLLMTQGLVEERQGFQAQATAEIIGIWGGTQSIVGPILVVPYTYARPVARQRSALDQTDSRKETEPATAHAYFLPEELSVVGAVAPETRWRGIYQAVVYSANVTLSGRFRPQGARLNLEAAEIHWDRARIVMGVSDLRGVRSLSPWTAPGGQREDFEAVELASSVMLGARAAGITNGADVPFQLQLAVQGSEQLAFAPAGKRTELNLKSEWPDPSFAGASLPTARDVSSEGFSARWESTHFTRGFPQAWADHGADSALLLAKVREAASGVEFRPPLEGYRLVERARKYGVLFFVLVFAVFFLFETLAGLRIHPLQYLLVGAALCLFFLAFLALSEVVSVALAYGVAAGACTAMVALYAWTFLSTGRRAGVIGSVLGLTYGYLYFVLQSRDYALLAGTAALFTVLGAVMYATRRMNWYAVDLAGPAAPAPLRVGGTGL